MVSTIVPAKSRVVVWAYTGITKNPPIGTPYTPRVCPHIYRERKYFPIDDAFRLANFILGSDSVDEKKFSVSCSLQDFQGILGKSTC